MVRFKGLLESAPDAMIIVDEQNTITMVNGRTEKMFGIDRANLLERPVFDLFPPQEKKRLALFAPDDRENWIEQLSNGGSCESRIIKQHDEAIPVEITLSQFDSQDGKLTSFYFRDISDRYAALHALKESEEKNRRIVQALQQEYVFYTQNCTGSLLYVTDSVERILGYSVSEFKESAFDIVLPDQAEYYQAICAQIVRGIPQPSYELAVRKADGSECYVQINTPVFDEGGNVILIESLLRDCTAERSVTTALASAKEAAEAANAAKSFYPILPMS